MTARPLEMALLGAIALLCIILMVEAWQIRPPSQVFPLAVLGITLALTLLAILRASASSPGGRLFEPGRARVVFVAAAGLMAYSLTMSMHYVVASFVFLFLGYLFLLERRSPRSILLAALVAAASTGFTWLTFAVWLGVNLPR